MDDDDSWVFDEPTQVAAVAKPRHGRGSPRPTYKQPTKTKIPGHGEVELQPLAPVSDAYRRFTGKTYDPRSEFPLFDEDRARKIAEAYQTMKHDPTDPRVKRSYDAMIDETMGQYRALKDSGYDFKFNGDDPYAASPALGYLDLRDNGRLSVFPTDSGFGTTETKYPGNPLLQRVGRVGDLDNATANDAFRVVHDMYGHFGPGNPFFRHKGEERAWLNHSGMYSPEALSAMTSETRGQNSWLNFGPFGNHNRKASSADTIYADQKSGLMDPSTWENYGGGGRVTKGSRKVEFVDDLDGLFGQPSRDASKLVRERAETKGKEGFAFGNEFFHSPLTRGEQTMVRWPDAYHSFVDQMKQQQIPFFNVHSHPVVAKTPGAANPDEGVTPAIGADLASRGVTGSMVYPSLGDIRSMNIEPMLSTMLIEGAGTPNGRVAIRQPGYTGMSPSAGFLMQRQPMRREARERIEDYNMSNGMAPIDPTGYSLLINDKLAELGLPVYMDKRSTTAGSKNVPLEDMLPDFKGYLSRHNVQPW